MDDETWADIIERNNIDEMRAEMERRLPMKKKPAARAKKLADLVVQCYLLDENPQRSYAVVLERVNGLAGVRWAIRDGGHCLNKTGEWEWEPCPSSRDDDFLSRCRWESADAALQFWVESGAESRFVEGK